MIREYLEPLLHERFSGLPFIYYPESAPFAALVSPCAQIGRLELCDDGDEITVYLTDISHGHFGCFDETLTTEEKEKRIALDVINFLSALFADRVVAFRLIGGLACGWNILTDGQILPSASILRTQFVWSGTIKNENHGG